MCSKQAIEEIRKTGGGIATVRCEVGKINARIIRQFNSYSSIGGFLINCFITLIMLV